MPAEAAAAAAAAAEAACIEAAAACTACMISGGYLPPPGAAAGGKGDGTPAKCGYGLGPPNGPNGPAAPGNIGGYTPPAAVGDEEIPFVPAPHPCEGGMQDPPPGRCILYIASSF